VRLLWHTIPLLMDVKEDRTMAAKKTEKAKVKKAAVKSAENGPKKAAKPVAAKGGAKKGSAAAPKPAKAAPKRVAKVAPPAPAAGAERPPVALAAAPTAQPRQQKVIPVEQKPSERTCPLVLDDIIAPEDFSAQNCFSCDEFDCRFYAAEESSGRARLFAADDGDDGFGDDDDDGFGGFTGDDGDDGYGDDDEME